MSKKLPIINVLLAVGLIAAGFFLWKPELKKFLDLKAELKQKETELKAKEDYFLNLNGLESKLKRYENELDKIDSALPDNLSLPALFSFIQKTSSENGLILEDLTSGGLNESSANPGVKEIFFNGSVTGSYSSFKNFLDALYNNAKLFEVESISFLSAEEGGLFTFDVKIKTYGFSAPILNQSLPEGTESPTPGYMEF